jgi:aspartyl-tRNA synthetase
MMSGFDKYFQIAPCFRDEDPRADRSPGEFYQLDMEMAFASQEDVFAVLENILPRIFGKFSAWKADKAPFVRIPYLRALEDFGTDKPDLRNPLRVFDVTGELQSCGFAAFSGKVVKAVAVHDFKGNRKFIDGLAEEMLAKEYAEALYWFKLGEDGAYAGGIAKYLTPAIQAALEKKLGLKKNSFVAVVVADKLAAAQKKAGILRTMLGAGLGLLEKNVYRFCWIVDFPMYELDEETGAVGFCHNPFSMPQGGMKALCEKAPLDILAYQYDIVCNGIELSSGAVRNHEPEIMEKAFAIAGMPKETVEKKFSALYNAFKFGAPPHAGIAPGVDRMVMLLCDTPNIREVITFPMNKNAQDLMMNAPSEVEQKQLNEANIKVK